MKTTKRSKRRLATTSLPALALLMTATLGGCVTHSEGQLSPKLSVGLPSDCERLAVEVPVPGVFDAKGKPVSKTLVLRRTQAALLLANDTLVQVRECVSDQRSDYQ